MGWALAKPIIRRRGFMMGFASLNPSYGAPRGAIACPARSH
jgi:hypothetical protein